MFLFQLVVYILSIYICLSIDKYRYRYITISSKKELSIISFSGEKKVIGYMNLTSGGNGKTMDIISKKCPKD